MTSTHRGSGSVPAAEDRSLEPRRHTGRPSRTAEAGDAFGAIFSDENLRRVVHGATKAVEAARVERAAAPALASRLATQPEAQARLLIENDRRFQTWGLVQELMERSNAAIFEADPLRSIRLARLATVVASNVAPEVFGAALTNDLRARAWTSLGNAYRYGSYLRAAGEAFRRACKLLGTGTGDPLEEANLLSMRASLALGTGAYAESLDFLARAERIYTELGESQLLGRILAQKASVVGWEDPRHGAVLSFRAEQHLDPAQDARLFLVARHNRIVWMLDAGQIERAQALLEHSIPLYQQFEDDWTLLHRGLVEAKLALALGDLDEAETFYQILLHELLDRGHQLNAALCALELAGCYLAHGRTRKASELAGAMAQHFREWGAHARAREAWAVLQHALAVEGATDDLLRQLARYLHRAWRNPRLAFSSSA